MKIQAMTKAKYAGLALLALLMFSAPLAMALETFDYQRNDALRVNDSQQIDDQTPASTVEIHSKGIPVKQPEAVKLPANQTKHQGRFKRWFHNATQGSGQRVAPPVNGPEQISPPSMIYPSGR